MKTWLLGLLKQTRLFVPLGAILSACLLSSCANQTVLERSLSRLEDEANSGQADSIHALCYRYSHGVNAEIDDKLAFKWCEKAARTQSPKSMTLLADLYFYGRGTEIQYKKALRLYRYSAERGIEKAMFMLYQHYSKGLGVEKDAAEARYYLGKAASRGYEPAQQEKHNLLINGDEQ